jgi:hypothetical protein
MQARRLMIVAATGALVLTAAPPAQASNSDRDGLSNPAEYRSCTNPRGADTNHGGVRVSREDADHGGVRNDREHYGDTEGHSDVS